MHADELRGAERRVSGFGIRDPGLRFKVWGLGLRVQGLKVSPELLHDVQTDERPRAPSLSFSLAITHTLPLTRSLTLSLQPSPGGSGPEGAQAGQCSDFSTLRYRGSPSGVWVRVLGFTGIAS